MATAFDTLRAATQLQEAGFEEAHAHALVTFADGAIENLATKDDLEKVATALDTSINLLEAKMDAEFGNVRTEFGNVRSEMAVLKRDIVIWLGGLMITLSGLVIAATSVLG